MWHVGVRGKGNLRKIHNFEDLGFSVRRIILKLIFKT
jgi:hypothetical protein